MASKLKKAIGAVKDQTSISLAKVANSSSNLEVAVLKATTHDDLPIEDRHVNEVLTLVSSDKVFAAACARAIGKRIGRTRNWIVALKSLMLVLRIFQDGDPYFPREVLHAMKRGAKILNLSSFRDDSNSSPWDFTAFIRTFALYLDERLDCFLTGKLQRRYTNRDKEPIIKQRSKRGSNSEPVRDMKPAMLLDKISCWQRLLDRAIATQPTGAAKANRLVQISLYAVVQESFDLYRDISDGLALLLDSFFHLQYHSCVLAFQTCVKAAKQFEELSAFYALCKTIGVGRTSEYPSVQTISNELIETLQEFLKDQTSFPASAKSPNRQLLLPASQNSPAAPPGDVAQCSETELPDDPFGSQSASLEDLISATELTDKRSPSISIDLEAYSYTNQLENQSQLDDAQSGNDASSSKSLPITSSLVDLVSFEDMDEQRQDPFEPGSATGWELALADNAVSSAQPTAPPGSESGLVHGLREGNWELVLAETTTIATATATTAAQSVHPLTSCLDSLYQQPHHYNPFLQEAEELTTMTATAALDGQGGFPGGELVPWTPTFQAAPTFSAQNPSQVEDDPFATSMGSEQMANGAMNQQSLLHQQQLWLQHQNKIIAKHTA